jgi:hypothetical protein
VASFNLPLQPPNVALLAACVTLGLIPHAPMDPAALRETLAPLKSGRSADVALDIKTISIQIFQIELSR